MITTRWTLPIEEYDFKPIPRVNMKGFWASNEAEFFFIDRAKNIEWEYFVTEKGFLWIQRMGKKAHWMRAKTLLDEMFGVGNHKLSSKLDKILKYERNKK